jgi:hypothetical protein
LGRTYALAIKGHEPEIVPSVYMLKVEQAFVYYGNCLWLTDEVMQHLPGHHSFRRGETILRRRATSPACVDRWH